MSSDSVNSAVNITTSERLLDTLRVDQSNAIQVQTVQVLADTSVDPICCIAQVPSTPNVTVKACGIGCTLVQVRKTAQRSASRLEIHLYPVFLVSCIPAPNDTTAIAVSATAIQIKRSNIK